MILFGQSLKSISLRATKIIYDGKRDKIYAIVKATDSRYGNSIVTINTNSGIIERNVFVGSDPVCMAITKDTNFIYIGLSGASQVKRYNIDTRTIDQTISLGSGTSGPLYAEDIVTVPISPDVFVISRMTKAVTPRHRGVAAYFKGNLLPNTTINHTGSNVIESSNDSNLVFGYNTETTENGIRRMHIDTINGVTLIDVNKDYFMGRDILYHNRLIYSDRGNVLDPYSTPPTINGSLNQTSWNTKVVADSKNNKIFFSNVSGNLNITRFNLERLTLINQIQILDAFPSGFQLPEATDIIRYGKTGLAIIVSENYFAYQDARLILYESCLVEDNADLDLTANADLTEAYVKDTITITLTLKNNSEIYASNILVTDSLNPSLTFLSASSSSGTITSASGLVIWSIDSINNSSQQTATIKYKVSQSGNRTHKFSVESGTYECNKNNNQSAISFSIQIPLSLLESTTSFKKVSIYPNPCKGYLEINLNALKLNESASIQISDITGKSIKLFRIAPNQENHLSLNLLDLDAGLYFLTIHNGIQSYILKFTKE